MDDDRHTDIRTIIDVSLDDEDDMWYTAWGMSVTTLGADQIFLQIDRMRARSDKLWSSG